MPPVSCCLQFIGTARFIVVTIDFVQYLRLKETKPMTMKVISLLIVAGALFACPSAKAQAFSASLVGSSQTGPAIGGVSPPSQAPWTLTSATVTISASGVVKANIKGLQIPSVGTATVTGIALSLVCGGAVVGTTDHTVLASNGNAKIRGTIALPSSCYGPQVMIVVTEFQGMTIPFDATQYIAANGFTAPTAADDRVPKPGDPPKQ
jgi:hypothetical protein